MSPVCPQSSPHHTVINHTNTVYHVVCHARLQVYFKHFSALPQNINIYECLANTLICSLSERCAKNWAQTKLVSVHEVCSWGWAALLAEISVKIKRLLLHRYESGINLPISLSERKQIGVFCQKHKLADWLFQLKPPSVGLSPGSLLWLVGWLVNMHSDHILRNLRQPGETGYKIPTGKGLNHETLGGIISPTTANISYTPITAHQTVRERILNVEALFTLWCYLYLGLEFGSAFYHCWGVTRKQ